MLRTVGYDSMDEFVRAVVPETVRFAEARPVKGLTKTGLGEQEASEAGRRKKID
jgi:glycine cleavage system pyridoxal-binding protein P